MVNKEKSSFNAHSKLSRLLSKLLKIVLVSLGVNSLDIMLVSQLVMEEIGKSIFMIL